MLTVLPIVSAGCYCANCVADCLYRLLLCQLCCRLSLQVVILSAGCYCANCVADCLYRLLLCQLCCRLSLQVVIMLTVLPILSTGCYYANCVAEGPYDLCCSLQEDIIMPVRNALQYYSDMANALEEKQRKTSGESKSNDK